MPGAHRPDTTLNDFLRRTDIKYKNFLNSMAQSFAGLQKKTRNRPLGQTNKYQSDEMLEKMSQIYPLSTYRRYLTYVLDFIRTNPGQFSEMVFRLGLSLSEAQNVEAMFVSGGYVVALDTTRFSATAVPTTTVATSAAQLPTTSVPTTTVATSAAQLPTTSVPTTTVATSAAQLPTTSVPTTTVATSAAQLPTTSVPTTTVATSAAQLPTTSVPTTTVATSAAQLPTTTVPTTTVATSAAQLPTTSVPTTTVAISAAQLPTKSVPTTTVATSAAQLSTTAATSTVNLIPATWNCAVGQVGFSKVELARDSVEFRDVMSVLSRTKSQFREIAKIERIENPRLWRQYQVQKEYTAAACPKGHTIERQLFHGTAEANLDSILAGGFDRIFSGLSAGATFGRGNYFATSFDYSARSRYSKNGDVLLCNVLVGESVQGENQHKALPFKAKFPGVRYESGVNHVRNPTIFVVYGDVAAYPAYLIKLGRYNREDDDL